MGDVVYTSPSLFASLNIFWYLKYTALISLFFKSLPQWVLKYDYWVWKQAC